MLIQESVIRLSIPLKEESVNWKAEKERLPVPPDVSRDTGTS